MPTFRPASFAAVLLLLMVAACDTSVDPFQENDLHYSIFGYLNASAHMQFVRVEVLRDGMITRAPATLDAEVTLTNVATGHIVSLRDSLFQYPDRTSFHNFYTTVDIEPTATYRLTVQGPNDVESSAQTGVPAPFPTPTVELPMPDCFPRCDPSIVECNVRGKESAFTTVRIEGVERLVAAQAVFYTGRSERGISFNHLADTMHTEGGMIQAQIDYGEDWCSLPSDAKETLRRVEVVVAAGTADWPAFMNMDQETKLLPNAASNVEGGVGFLGGVVTDTVMVYPYDE